MVVQRVRPRSNDGTRHRPRPRQRRSAYARRTGECRCDPYCRWLGRRSIPIDDRATRFVSGEAGAIFSGTGPCSLRTRQASGSESTCATARMQWRLGQAYFIFFRDESGCVWHRWPDSRSKASDVSRRSSLSSPTAISLRQLSSQPNHAVSRSTLLTGATIPRRFRSGFAVSTCLTSIVHLPNSYLSIGRPQLYNADCLFT